MQYPVMNMVNIEQRFTFQHWRRSKNNPASSEVNAGFLSNTDSDQLRKIPIADRNILSAVHFHCLFHSFPSKHYQDPK